MVTEARLRRWRTSAYAVWAVIGALVLVAVTGWLIGRIAGALAPFALAFVIVFLLEGPVRTMNSRGLQRGIAVSLSFAIATAGVVVALVFIVPPLVRQVVEFATTVPSYIGQGQQLLNEFQARYTSVVIPDWVRAVTASVASALSQGLLRLGNVLAQGVISAGGGIAVTFFDVFLAVVIAFWTLKDLPKIRTELRSLVGERYEDDLENLIRTVVRVVGGYLRGQTVASLVTGLIAGVGLAIVGVPYALVLGIITFVFNYIPYVGPIVAGVIAALVGLLVGLPQALGAIIIVIAAQQLTDLFVTPRVMSEQVDLHPTLVIFSLLVGGTLFGFWGMVLSIPFAATAKGLFVYYYERKTSRPLSSTDGALFRSSPDSQDGDRTGTRPAEAGDDEDTTPEQGVDA